MDSQVIAQRDFSAGQLDETALRRDDTDIQRAGLRKARNVRILNSGAITRRPGRRVLFSTTGRVEIIRPAPGELWYMIFEAGQVTFRKSDLSLSATITGMPWDATTLKEMRWVESGSSITVAHRAFRMRVLTYDPVAQTWTAATFAFADEPTGGLRQPFYNFFLGSGIKLNPSARKGNITLTFTGGVLDNAHAGLIFRYAEQQIRINSVTSSTTATATVLQELPPTWNVQVDNVNGAEPGDVVEGVTSGAKGQVIVVDDVNKVLQVLTTKNWNGFEANEVIVGPRSRGKVISQAEQNPAATTQWDEPLISAYRGWPGCVSKDQQRIIFTDFKQLGPAIVWSATGTLNDFKIGAEKDDAIFELVPENCTVVDVVGGADEFVFTDLGEYYIPVSTTNPLIPGSIEFREISRDGSARVRPQPTIDGLVFLNPSRTRVLALVGTGQTARPYVVEDLSEFHSALLKSPAVLATASADVSAPERYLYAANDDGTLAVARYQKRSGTIGWVGWVPWDGKGVIKWVAADGPEVVVVAEYVTEAGTIRFAEVFDDDLILDATRALTTANWAAGTTLSVEKDGWYRGDYVLQADGSLSGGLPADFAATQNGGFNFEVEAEPFIPHAEAGASRKQRLRPRKIKQYAATVEHRGALKVGRRLVATWNAGENQEVAPPLRTTTYRGRILGRDFDPTWSVLQELPGELTIFELTTEVTL